MIAGQRVQSALKDPARGREPTVEVRLRCLAPVEFGRDAERLLVMAMELHRFEAAIPIGHQVARGLFQRPSGSLEIETNSSSLLIRA